MLDTKEDIMCVTVSREGVVIEVPLLIKEGRSFEEAEHLAKMAGLFGLLRILSKINEYNGEE